MSVCLIYHRRMPDLHVLDDETARLVERVCDAIVPGSARVRPAVYIDALLARMDDGRAGRDARRLRVGGRRRDRGALGTPEFLQVRALAVEAFYSDFVAPGVDATGAWAEIDFNTPLATRLAKDWSYLGIYERTLRCRRRRLRCGRGSRGGRAGSRAPRPLLEVGRTDRG